MRYNPFDFRVASEQERRAITDRLTNKQLSELYALYSSGYSALFAKEVKLLFGQYAPAPSVARFLEDEMRRRRQVMADEAVTPYLNWLHVTIENLPADAYMQWRRLFGESYATHATYLLNEISQKPKFSRYDVVKVIRASKIVDPSTRFVSTAALVKLKDGSIGAIYRYPLSSPVAFTASTITEVVEQIPSLVADGLGISDALGQMAAEASILVNPLRTRR